MNIEIFKATEWSSVLAKHFSVSRSVSFQERISEARWDVKKSTQSKFCCFRWATYRWRGRWLISVMVCLMVDGMRKAWKPLAPCWSFPLTNSTQLSTRSRQCWQLESLNKLGKCKKPPCQFGFFGRFTLCVCLFLSACERDGGCCHDYRIRI